MFQKYFELFKNNGYAFKLYFIDRKIKKKLNVYIIAEIRDVNNEKKYVCSYIIFLFMIM